MDEFQCNQCAEKLVPLTPGAAQQGTLVGGPTVCNPADCCSQEHSPDAEPTHLRRGLEAEHLFFKQKRSTKKDANFTSCSFVICYMGFTIFFLIGCFEN